MAFNKHAVGSTHESLAVVGAAPQPLADGAHIKPVRSVHDCISRDWGAAAPGRCWSEASPSWATRSASTNSAATPVRVMPWASTSIAWMPRYFNAIDAPTYKATPATAARLATTMIFASFSESYFP